MIPLAKSAFLAEKSTRQLMADFLLTDKPLSMGEKCACFEEEFAKWQGRRFAVLFNSGSSANLALIQSLLNMQQLLRLGGGDVMVSGLTWSTNIMPLVQLGLTPVPLDVNLKTLNVATVPEYSIFFTTNVLGFAGALSEWENSSKIILLEDNCEALGTIVNGKKTGNFGYASTFSFYVAHHMSTIEGGMVATDSYPLAEMLKMVRAHGWTRDSSMGHREALRQEHAIEPFNLPYTFFELGYNLRPTELTGLIGLKQLKHIDEAIEKRHAAFEFLHNAVEHNPELQELDYSHIDYLSPFAFPVIAASKAVREKYLKRFANAEVEVRPILAGNITRHPFWKKYVGEPVDLPGVDRVASCGFYFGLDPALTMTELEVLRSCLS